MKKSLIIIMFATLLGTTSCSMLGSATDTAAITSGAACGKALVALNSSKKAGTLSIANPNDLSNILIVINAYNGLKANKENASYKKSFATGMVSGGSGVINAANATSITNSLLNASGLDGINTSNIAQRAQTVGTIIQLLGALN